MRGSMLKRLVFNDEVGAVTADWITLTAGIILLGVMVVFSVMNSAGYLMSEFDDLNSRYANADYAENAKAGVTASAQLPAGVGLSNAAVIGDSASMNGQAASAGAADPRSRIPQ